MRPIKTSLLGGAALSVLALGMTSVPAFAFDEVYWDWDAYINEYGKIKVDVDVYSDPSGLVQIEKLQMLIGDVEAKSIVHDITNLQPDNHGHHGPFHWGWHNQNRALDALDELPEVVSEATAVGNNQNIESEVAVMLHDGQFVFGGFGYGHGWHDDIDLPHYGPLSDNTNLALVGALLDAGAEHTIRSADIEATSAVWDILNATVDSSATAVANNINVEVATGNAENQLVMGDITQFAYADVTAKSYVSDVTLKNYKNLGTHGRPIVNSVATAVGNNVNIKVGGL
jgi:hypothetical protein